MQIKNINLLNNKYLYKKVKQLNIRISLKETNSKDAENILKEMENLILSIKDHTEYTTTIVIFSLLKEKLQALKFEIKKFSTKIRNPTPLTLLQFFLLMSLSQQNFS